MARFISPTERDQLSAEITLLERLDGHELKRRWKALYGSDAPARISRNLLSRALAYRLQERALGGLSAPARRLLKRLADDARSQRPASAAVVRKVGPGSVLIREWGGTRYQVTVFENEVVFRDKRYRSLSEVARLITGSRWSGPLFFGLRTRAKEAGGDDAR
jgi:Protein of unknown function (DUF2924)